MQSSKCCFEKLEILPQEIRWKTHKGFGCVGEIVATKSLFYYEDTKELWLWSHDWHVPLREENLPKILGEVIWALKSKRKVWCDK